MLILETTLNNFSIYTVGQTVAFLVFNNTALWVKWLNKNTDVMQQDAGFIIADFLYLFQASCAHHQEYKILTWQSPVQIVL